jgi:hypothetical protein
VFAVLGGVVFADNASHIAALQALALLLVNNLCLGVNQKSVRKHKVAKFPTIYDVVSAVVMKKIYHHC